MFISLSSSLPHALSCLQPPPYGFHSQPAFSKWSPFPHFPLTFPPTTAWLLLLPPTGNAFLGAKSATVHGYNRFFKFIFYFSFYFSPRTDSSLYVAPWFTPPRERLPWRLCPAHTPGFLLTSARHPSLLGLDLQHGCLLSWPSLRVCSLSNLYSQPGSFFRANQVISDHPSLRDVQTYLRVEF